MKKNKEINKRHYYEVENLLDNKIESKICLDIVELIYLTDQTAGILMFEARCESELICTEKLTRKFFEKEFNIGKVDFYYITNEDQKFDQGKWLKDLGFEVVHDYINPNSDNLLFIWAKLADQSLSKDERIFPPINHSIKKRIRVRDVCGCCGAKIIYAPLDTELWFRNQGGFIVGDIKEYKKLEKEYDLRSSCIKCNDHHGIWTWDGNE